MDPFPEDIRQFLDGHIESIDQLEILRVLGENPTREWSAAALASEVQAGPQDVAAHLAAMRGRGLIVTDHRDGEVVARHGPVPANVDLVARLLQLYKERPVTMIKLVYARAKDPLRNFAEAFRFRKEDG